MSTFSQFLSRSRRDRFLFLEALLTLTWVKLLVHTVPFRRLSRHLGQPQAKTPDAIPAHERAIAVDISWAVQAAARHVPLGFVCLPQAIAAKWMLRRRGIASTLYLGVAFDTKDRTEMLAHAWLRAGDKILTGAAEAARHHALASFADFSGGA